MGLHTNPGLTFDTLAISPLPSVPHSRAMGIHWDVSRMGLFLLVVPSGELTICYGKSPFLMGKSIISMAMFNSFLYVHQRVICCNNPHLGDQEVLPKNQNNPL